MKITYLGHSSFVVETESHHILFDPFLTGNPNSPVKADEVQADAILLTHAHADHVGDTIAIAKRTGATVVAVYELATWLSQQGIPTHPMHLGGSHVFPFGRVKFTLAFHGAAIETETGLLYGGNPAGILFSAAGKTFYHSGDTALFGDMKLLGELNRIDVAALPIGDNFTMGPEDALLAAEWIKAKTVIPMHYDTFPLIAQDAASFVRQLAHKGIKGQALKPGETISV